MTTTADRRSDAPSQHAATAAGPTLRSALRSARGPVLLTGLLVLAGVLVAAVRATGDSGYLDPDAYDPSGARAVRALLEEEGVRVTRLQGAAAVRARASSSATVLVADAPAMEPAELQALRDLPGELVVLGAQTPALAALALPADASGDVEPEDRRAACDLAAAVRAGTVRLGGTTYAARAAGAVGCYASGGAATLLRLPAERTTLVGSGAFLTNDELDDGGAAALALGLLGTSAELLWVLPDPLAAGPDEQAPSLWSLYDRSVRVATLGLVLAVVVVALWRARRLGRVVTEPLPVVVRAAEAVEGRSRLYRAAAARATAAESLRAGTRDRLTRRLGLPPDAARGSLVGTTAARCGRDPGDVDVLLYGAAPADDAALVRLASDLDALTLEVARS